MIEEKITAQFYKNGQYKRIVNSPKQLEFNFDFDDETVEAKALFDVFKDMEDSNEKK